MKQGKSLPLNICHEGVRKLLKQLSVSLSKMLICYLIRLYLLERWIFYRCFKRNFPENIQAFGTSASFEISENFEQFGNFEQNIVGAGMYIFRKVSFKTSLKRIGDGNELLT